MEKMYDVPKKKSKELDSKFGIKVSNKPILKTKPKTKPKPKTKSKFKHDITKIPGFKFGRGTE